MSLFYEAHRNAFSFGIWHITESEDELEKLSGCSAPERLSNPSRRREFLAIRALFVSMGLNPERIEYLPSGKPFLRDDSSTISLSHTKNYAAVVVASHLNVGIDIEQRTERVARVRHKYMHPQEEEALTASGLDTPTGLLIHWCAKEAVFKAVPDDAIDFAREIRVTHVPLPLPLGETTEMGAPTPDSSTQDSKQVDSSIQNSLQTIGEVQFLRTGICFQLEAWSTQEFVMTICHSLTDPVVLK